MDMTNPAQIRQNKQNLIDTYKRDLSPNASNLSNTMNSKTKIHQTQNSSLVKAGANILMGGPNVIRGEDQLAAHSVKSILHPSQQNVNFKATLDEIEADILQLAQEVAFCKKEVGILHSEQGTIEVVAKTQCTDIRRYLEKETAILEDVINKA